LRGNCSSPSFANGLLEQIPMKWHRYFPPLIPAQAGIQERTGSPLSRGRAEEEFAIRLERNVL